MDADVAAPLLRHVDRLEATDAHAAFHVPLLVEAEEILHGRRAATEHDRRELAARLERWRYQHLHQRAGQLDDEDRRLADALDLAANALAGRAPRAARWPRGSLISPLPPCGRGAGGEGGGKSIMLPTPLTPNPSPAQRERGTHPGPLPEGERDLAEAEALTRQFFSIDGRRRMVLYAPLYLSSHCINHCTYCGFRYPQTIERKHLAPDEALRQAEILAARGFRHVLLVGGDYPSLTTPGYYAEIIRLLSGRGLTLSIEIAPQTTDAYAELAAAGAEGVTLYQETYDESLYAQYHPRGSKTSYDWRLEGPQRAAEAGFRRLGLGILLGLAEPWRDLAALVRHGQYLAAQFPDRRLAFSLPRIHEAPSAFAVPYAVDDETFVRMYCTLRQVFPQAELVLSTRESPAMRARLAKICITQMSAGSSTVPGGYQQDAAEPTAGGQFPVCDQRSPAEVAAWLDAAGFAVRWDY